MNRLAIISGTVSVLIASVAFAMWANDLRQDRKHIVTAVEPTPLFAGTGRTCDTRQQIAVVQRGAVLPVRRIRYLKDCATLDVNAPYGQLSHIVLGVGAVEVQPALR